MLGRDVIFATKERNTSESLMLQELVCKVLLVASDTLSL